MEMKNIRLTLDKGLKSDTSGQRQIHTIETF